MSSALYSRFLYAATFVAMTARQFFGYHELQYIIFEL